MFFLYNIIIYVIILISPLIILIRVIKKKENPKRFLEKFSIYSKRKVSGKLVWFHAVSIGEFKSIIPLIRKYEKKKNISQILITSSTLSSSKLISKYKFRKVVHQFFPIDNHAIVKNFLNYWQPSIAIFVDSEVWPNMLIQLKKLRVPIILINARITRKSFLKWSKFKNFSNYIFNQFDLCISSNLESIKYLKQLGAKNIKYFGNLKFAEVVEEKIDLKVKFRTFLKSKKIFCASSTHEPEEKIIGEVHKRLKEKYSNLITIIIPRHIERTDYIENDLKSLNLRTLRYSMVNKINNSTDIIIVDSFGMTKPFFSKSKSVFLGGSLIKHGGQNPLEAVRFGCNILYGPSIHNFKEIYQFLDKEKISYRTRTANEIFLRVKKLMEKKTNKNLKNRINYIGKKILNKCFQELNQYL